ncbi:MAG TPA: hypothetical protein VET87_01185 [Rubrivivax sp.]|nr:hypothetical protein [Rubrivivax sp.]
MTLAPLLLNGVEPFGHLDGCAIGFDADGVVSEQFGLRLLELSLAAQFDKPIGDLAGHHGDGSVRS